MSTLIQDLYVQKGQSVWLNGYDKSRVPGNQLKQMIQNGLRGMILDYNSMLFLLQNTNEYDKQITLHHIPDEDPIELFNKLFRDEVRAVADLFAPIYHVTMGLDGYISVPVDPRYSHDNGTLISETLRLFKTIRRPNLMFQIPATTEGLSAARELILSGVSVHLTDVFSVEQYKKAFAVYADTLEQVVDAGVLVRTIACFVSVVCEHVHHAFARHFLGDKTIEKILEDFKGDLGLYTGARIYHLSANDFLTDRLESLKQKGCHRQRLIWGPCPRPSQKNSALECLEAFIAQHTILALDHAGVELFIEEGHISDGISEKMHDSAEDIFCLLQNAGVDCAQIFMKLQYDAIARKQSSFSELLRTLKYKKKW
jgi:hypothetical protein